MTLDLEILFGVDGPLAALLPGYALRPQQLAMAKAVAQAIGNREILVSEAGTGVGKTFAYLIPALASKESVVVSTGTRNLQDQLFSKDLPTVRKVVGKQRSIALLKGRSNYLCLLRLDGLPRRERNPQLRRIRQWADTTTSGDIGELAGVPEDSALWRHVTSTIDTCLGQDCPRLRDCHLVRARRRAQEADLVVINHHLLLADMNLKREGVSDLLPQADAFVVDEAHQIYATASRFFGTALSGRQLQELASDSDAEHLRSGGKVSARPEVARELEKAVLDLRLALGEQVRRVAWSELREQSAVSTNLNTLREALDGLRQWLEQTPKDHKGLDNCRERCEKLTKHLQLVSAAESDDFVRWLDIQHKGFVLNATPMDISGLFQESMQSYGGAWIFTSATLAVGGSFQHFCGRLGLTETHEQCLDSPFDYRRNAVLYHPQGLPAPNDQDYTRRLLEIVAPVIRAAQGRTFMLFTSYRALREAETILQGRLDYPLLVQGTLSRNELLNRFRRLGNAVLLGTSSFWEGVDVRGSALSCVIIDRLPFAAPGDPVLAARIDALRASGGNPFRDHQLPAAVITLKQGVGRLIRDVGDKGVMVLCDPRLLTRDYGRVFLDSLPPMTRTRKLEVVERFFRLESEERTVGAAALH